MKKFVWKGNKYFSQEYLLKHLLKKKKDIKYNCKMKFDSLNVKTLVSAIDAISEAYVNKEDVIIPNDLIKDFIKLFDPNMEIPGYLNIAESPVS